MTTAPTPTPTPTPSPSPSPTRTAGGPGDCPPRPPRRGAARGDEGERAAAGADRAGR
nr:hypothetical protein [Parafrankia sp. BMG5.11]